jgi:nucleoside 2-deoxyribosyltransferase
LIDDRLRVEIRQSRFLLADLTHHNKGAYWEAGFAEGLGKPVIYLCRKDVFEDKSQGTHFDTNHHLTVVWDLENLGEAAEKLKATIRATLPGEAQISD